jgi:hypothetical protein
LALLAGVNGQVVDEFMATTHDGVPIFVPQPP